MLKLTNRPPSAYQPEGPALEEAVFEGPDLEAEKSERQVMMRGSHSQPEHNPLAQNIYYSVPLVPRDLTRLTPLARREEEENQALLDEYNEILEEERTRYKSLKG